MQADVFIVGAGPTGLLLAGDLAEAGVSVRIFERRGETSNITRAFAIHARTLEELDIRGIAGPLLTTGAPVRKLSLFASVYIDLGKLPSGFPFLQITPQYETEKVLRQRAEALGVEIIHDATVVGLTQDAHGVDLRVRTEDGTESTHRASYVVGADGVNSTVRQALGVPFPGRSIVKSIMLTDVLLTDPPEDILAVNAVGDGFAFIAPFGDGWYRVFAWDRRKQVDDSAPLTLDEVRAVTIRALGTDFGMHDPRWMSRFHSDERQVPRYRVGRVFLAGDAAHCHSPAGGQGMNTGIQDAANLGWKLAAAVKGWGGDRLLDTYHDERHPIGRQVLRSSGAIIRLAMIKSWPGRKIRNLACGALLRVPPIAAMAAGSISGIGFHYQAATGAHRLVGTRIGNINFTGGPLFEALRGGRFVLVSTTRPDIDLPQVDVVAPEDSPTEAVLVRPDGYVAWAGDITGYATWARDYFAATS